MFFLMVWVFLSSYGQRQLLENSSSFNSIDLWLENTDKVPEHTEVYVLDHGGDTIMSLLFQQFVVRKGIFWQTAPRRTPNYNGLVEQNIQSGLSMSYWPLTSAAARMILNRLPRSSNPSHCTPFKAYFRRKPDLSSFRVFGCIA